MTKEEFINQCSLRGICPKKFVKNRVKDLPEVKDFTEQDIEDMFEKWDIAQYMAGNRGLRNYEGALCTKYFINRSDSKYM